MQSVTLYKCSTKRIFWKHLYAWAALCLAAVGRLSADPPHALSEIPLLYLANTGTGEMRYLAKAPGIEAAFFDRELLLTTTQGAVRLQFIGVDHSVVLKPVEPLQGRVNFLVGADQSKWIRDAQAYRGIRYRSLYKGIDAVFSSARRRLKSDFIVAPRADPGQIRIAYVGARVEVDKGGGLRLRLGTGEVTEAPPKVYQLNSAGIQEPVSSAYLLHDDATVGFRLGPYDRSRTLWIDPEISYSTYLGSSYGDGATSVAIDGAGAVYLAGWTEAPNFPAVNAYSTARGGVDAFVAKLNPAGTALVYAT